MRITRPDLAALGLCAILVVAITVLAALHVPVPDVLPYLATGALSAGAGLGLNVGTSSSTSTTSSAPAEPVTVPAQPSAPVLEQAAPVATHAP